MNSSQWQTFRWNKAGHRYKSSGSSRTRQIVICQKPFQLKRSQFKDWHLLNGMLDNFNLISPFSQSAAALISVFWGQRNPAVRMQWKSGEDSFIYLKCVDWGIWLFFRSAAWLNKINPPKKQIMIHLLIALGHLQHRATFLKGDQIGEPRWGRE